MPSQSPTIDSIVVMALTICTEDCANAAENLNNNAKLRNATQALAAQNTTAASEEIVSKIEPGSSSCSPGCTSPSSSPSTGQIEGSRFLFPFETNKDILPISSKDSEGQLLTFQTTVVNLVIDLAATGESVDPVQIQQAFEASKEDLSEEGLIIESIELATQSPSSVPSSEPSATPSDSPSAKPSASPSESPSGKPSASPSDKPS